MNTLSERKLHRQNNNGGTDTASPCHDAALDYIAKYGWYVFEALIIQNKKTKKWAKQGRWKGEKTNGNNWGYTNDPAEIDRYQYWIKYPDDPIGLPTGVEQGFFVIEVDTPEGHDVDGIASLAAFVAANSPLPET